MNRSKVAVPNGVVLAVTNCVTVTVMTSVVTVTYMMPSTNTTTGVISGVLFLIGRNTIFSTTRMSGMVVTSVGLLHKTIFTVTGIAYGVSSNNSFGLVSSVKRDTEGDTIDEDVVNNWTQPST
ncbi:hypothetical protein PR001_g11221 [Phytophthora rubi]|uniref:Uncharacterized protein n=1 Tax=Phytophthora rubi TaxID=129364 RepID=A0A6A3MP49_9STRA|nr:hypothetical protein PR001_g11221 [Phytophthora rubi]